LGPSVGGAEAGKEKLMGAMYRVDKIVELSRMLAKRAENFWVVKVLKFCKRGG